jgi:phosphotransferase system HPr-like phosphotransfer protein
MSKNGPSGTSANAKSILAVLGLGVNQGDKITIETEGERAEEALKALIDLIHNNFGENLLSAFRPVTVLRLNIHQIRG